MKIEKINDRQICCIISTQDLINNKLKLSELALGSSKAKGFFRDIMIKARDDYGFDGLNSPLMIEAMPQPPDSLKLIITKMKPDEHSGMNIHSDTPEEEPKKIELHFKGADSVLNLFRKAESSDPASKKPSGRIETSAPMLDAIQKLLENALSENDEPKVVTEAFRFASVDNVITAAKAMKGFYDGENSLYSETGQSTYLLVLRSTSETPEEFNKICNILTEYSIPVHCTASGESCLKEHGNEMISGNALQVLAEF